MQNIEKFTTTMKELSFDNTAVAFRQKSSFELKKSYLLFSSMNSNALVSFGTGLVTKLLAFNFPVKGVIKKTLFEQFCGGEDRDDCDTVINQLGKAGIGTILDFAIEGASDEKGFNRTEKETIANIKKASTSQNIPFCVFKPTGLGPNKVFEKLHLGETLSEIEQAAFQRMYSRFENICENAYSYKVRVLVDAEETWFQKPIDDIVYQMMERYNKEEVIIYNTFQLYCKDKFQQLVEVNEIALAKGYKLGAKLVRGAYMEKERERAEAQGYPSPIQPNKAATDTDYDKALAFCIDHLGQIAVVNGSHNENSNYLMAELMEKAGISPNNPDAYFAQLYGMSDHISYNLSNAGYNVAKYVPYGPVKAVMPYLFRRASENTSIAGQSSREYNLIKTELRRRKKIK